MRTIPNRGQHLYRYYGAYSNRTRRALPPNDASQTRVTVPEPEEPDFDKPSSPSRVSWARLIRKVFEVDPLLCGNCGAQMKIIAVLTAPKVVDRIIVIYSKPTRLRHLVLLHPSALSSTRPAKTIQGYPVSS